MFKKKSMLSMMMAMVLLLTMVPMSAFAEPALITGTIELDGVIEPVVGAVPQFAVKIKDGTNLDNRYKIIPADDPEGNYLPYWMVWDNTNAKWEDFYRPDSSETKHFENDRVYLFSTTLRAGTEYFFPNVVTQYDSITAKINNKEANATSIFNMGRNHDNTLLGVHMFFPLLSGAPQEYTATFNTNGGNSIAPIQVPAGLPNLGNQRIPDPVKPGYKFVKWNRVGLTDTEIPDDYVPPLKTKEEILRHYVFRYPMLDNYTFIAEWVPEGSTPPTQQEPDATAPTELNAKYGQVLSAIEITGATGTTAGKWAWKNPSAKVGDVGTRTHEAIFTPSNTTLYKTKEATINVEVAKADEPTIANVTKQHKVRTTETLPINVMELLPSDMEVTDVTLGAPTGDDIFAANPAYANGEISYTIKSDAEVGETATVNVVINSSTHEDPTFDLIVKIIDKEPIEVAIGKTNFVYSGNAIAATEVKATATSNGNTVAGTAAWVSGKEPGTNAGEHSVEIVFTPEDTENYATANKSFNITIAAAKVNGEPKISTVNEAGKKLSDITLEENTLTPAGGTLEWKLPLDTVIEANKAYEWTYTVAGGNYEVKTGSFTPYVVAPPSSGGSSSGGGGGGSYSSVRPDSGSSTSTQTPAQPTQPTSTTTTTAPTGQPKAVLAIGQSAYQTTEGTKSSDVAPRIMEGRTFLPAKVIADVLGIQTSFDNATKTTTFSIEIDGVKNTVSVTRGKNVMLVNGVEVPLSTNSMIVDGRTMLPIRDIQTAFNSLGFKSTLVWDGATKQISLY